jgi:DNA-binding NtrC family response regulator
MPPSRATPAIAGTVTPQQIVAIRVYLAKHWKFPATCGPFQVEISPACLSDLAISTEPDQEIAAGAVQAEIQPAVDYKTSLELVDASLIRAALDRNRGNIIQTARELEISKNTLRARMAKYGIVP